jgi:hypothetical protein
LVATRHKERRRQVAVAPATRLAVLIAAVGDVRR